MKFIIQNKVLVIPDREPEKLAKSFLREVKEHFTITNPAYQAQINMGLKAWGIDATLAYYEDTKRGIFIPVGGLPEILELADKMGIKVWPTDLTDLRIEPRSPKYFNKINFNGELREHQKGLFDVLPGKTVGVIQAPTGSGKCLGKNTKVLMYNGDIKLVQNIQKGDLLMGPDSKPRKVKSTCTGQEMLYKVHQKKGDPYIVNESHILSLKQTSTRKNPRNKAEEKLAALAGTIKNISVRDYLKSTKYYKHIHKGWKSAVDFNVYNDDPLLDPYFVGIWLGDGTKRRATITTADNAIKDYIYKYAEELGMDVRKEENSKNSNNYHIIAPNGKMGPNTNNIISALSFYNLKNNKHIPKRYKCGSRQERLELLAGLIDTDGSLAGPSGFDIIQKSKVLAEDIKFLCASLGFAVKISKCQKKCSNNGKVGTYYRLGIYGDIDEVPVRINRKKPSKRGQKKDHSVCGIHLEKLDVGEYFGFEVEGPDRLFLLGDFTVTHNTVTFVYQTVNNTLNTMILTHTKELAEQTIQAFLNFSNLERDNIGFVGSGEFELKPITVALLQTVRSLEGKQLDQALSYFGQIITDETHIIAADTYYRAISNFPAKYKWGYSATPRREDGLTKVIHWANGPLIHKVPRQNVKLIKPTYEKIYTDYYFPLFDTTEYQTMLTHMAEDEKRNKQILDEFKKKEDVPSVFLCGRTAQVRLLHKQIPSSIMLTSNMTKKARKKAMAKLKNKEVKHVVSTWNLFSTGIDVPHLEGMYICSPMKSENILRQGGGRLMRQSPGKTSAFIKDFVDIRIGLLAGQAKVRGKILSNL